MSAAPMPTVDALLDYYLAVPEHQASLCDWLFREWALRPDDDPWAIVAGGAFDAIQLHRRPVGGRG